jgi:hypothetical protein
MAATSKPTIHIISAARGGWNISKAPLLTDVRAWRAALLMWLAQHSVLALCFMLGIRYGSHVKDVPTAWRILLTGWDGKDIASVAANGYASPRDAAFYPLYPLLEHLLAPLFGGHFALAGWVLASLCLLVAFAVLHILVESETGNASLADLALCFTAFSPFAVFLGLAYTEPLFVLLALLMFFYARRQRWLAAGSLTVLAVLTRGAGIMLIVPLAVEALSAMRRQGSWHGLWHCAAALALPPLALMGYWLYQLRIYGTSFAGSRAEAVYWTRGLDWPWYGPLQTLDVLLRHSNAGFAFRAVLDLTMLAVALALCAAMVSRSWRRQFGLHASFAAYAWATLLFALSVPLHPLDGSDAMFSFPRYMLVAFPLAIPVAAAAFSSASLRLILVTTTLLAFALLTTLYAIGIGIG